MSGPAESRQVQAQRQSQAQIKGQARAWGWVRHLRDGGTTPWSQWQTEAEPAGRVVPGAQQLELLRRLNEAAAVPEGLAVRVMEASAPGRGRPDLELVGAAHDSRFGAQPVDPSQLPDAELLRVATSLLAEDLVALGPVAGRPEAFPRPWRRRYRLVGDPLLADPLRSSLIARGRAPRPGGEIVVVGADLDRMLADAWTANAFENGAPAWGSWLETWRRRHALPPRVDLPRAVQTWTRRRGAEHVHVLIEGTPGWDRLPALVGLRRLETPPRPGADAVELARGLASVLGLMVTPPRRTVLLREGLLPRLPADTFCSPVSDAGGSAVGDTGALPGVPQEHREWTERAARRMERRLAAAGYAVNLVARDSTGHVGTDGRRVLSLAMRLLLGGWKERV